MENLYEEITVNGKKEKIIVKFNDGSIEDNNDIFNEDTIELKEVIKEVANND